MRVYQIRSKCGTHYVVGSKVERVVEAWRDAVRGTDEFFALTEDETLPFGIEILIGEVLIAPDVVESLAARAAQGGDQ